MSEPLEHRPDEGRVAWALVKLHDLALKLGWRFDKDAWCWVRPDGSILSAGLEPGSSIPSVSNLVERVDRRGATIHQRAYRE